MNFSWKEFLIFAKYLLENYSNNSIHSGAALRTVTSRSYYAAFHVSLDYAVNFLNYQRPTKDEHKSLINFYVSRQSMQEKKIGEDLKRLRNKRNNADYEFYSNYRSSEAVLSVKFGERIIQLINSPKI